MVVKTDAPEEAGGHFVSLREPAVDARVVLGCLVDAAGRVHQWIEVWVQDVAGLSHCPAIYREALSNRVLDERWVRRLDALERSDPAGVVRTG